MKNTNELLFISSTVLALCISTSAPVTDGDHLGQATPATISFTDLPDSDGTVGPPGAGESRSVNPAVYHIELAEVGPQAVQAVPGMSSASVLVNGTWSALGEGTNGGVHALVVDDAGNLYAGGVFTQAGGDAATLVARWDGTSWSALGEGVTDGIMVNAVAIDSDGNLYAGGNFLEAGGVAVNHVAKWDGMSWSSLDGGISSLISSSAPEYVEALAVDEAGRLYAAGDFDAAGGVPANDVAMWDGNGWSALADGPNFGELYSVRALAFDGAGNLYAGGVSEASDGTSSAGVAVWDGSNWRNLGEIMTGRLAALAINEGGTLYVGGSFSPDPEFNVAFWRGSSWSSITKSFNGNISVLEFDYTGRLYAGGPFPLWFSEYSGIALWDGSIWTGLGSGLTGGQGVSSADAVAFDVDGDVYVGGRFNMAGGVPANYVAKWTPEAVTAIERTEDVPTTFELSPAYPNPFNPRTRFTLTLTSPEHVTIRVYDALGREVAKLHDGLLAAGAHQLFWKAEGMATGTYVITAESGEVSASQRVLFVK